MTERVHLDNLADYVAFAPEVSESEETETDFYDDNGIIVYSLFVVSDETGVRVHLYDLRYSTSAVYTDVHYRGHLTLGTQNGAIRIIGVDGLPSSFSHQKSMTVSRVPCMREQTSVSYSSLSR